MRGNRALVALVIFLGGACIGALALDGVRVRLERDSLRTAVDYMCGGYRIDGLGHTDDDEFEGGL